VLGSVIAMKKILYSVITNNWDRVRVPGHVSKGWEAVLFSDVPLECRGWDRNVVIPAEQQLRCPKRTSRLPKVLAHQFLPDADISLYMDGCVQTLCDLDFLVERFLGMHDLATLRHPRRRCIYAEAAEVKRRGLDAASIVDAQMARYVEEQYPFNNGLSACRVLLRRHTPAIRALNELWWQEISNGSRRDQLSLEYCRWKLNMSCSRIETLTRRMNYFYVNTQGSRR
jgi:hypothetical protein